MEKLDGSKNPTSDTSLIREPDGSGWFVYHWSAERRGRFVGRFDSEAQARDAACEASAGHAAALKELREGWTLDTARRYIAATQPDARPYGAAYDAAVKAFVEDGT